jgi:hypothetical protein
MVSKPTVVSTNWFLRSPFKVTGTPTTYSIQNVSESFTDTERYILALDTRDPELR